MMSLRKKSLILTVCLLSLIGFMVLGTQMNLTTCNSLSDNVIKVKADLGTIAFVYKDNMTIANSFLALLDTNYSVTLIKMSEIGAGTFIGFNLTIIGPDTGDIAIWGNASQIAAVTTANTPVIGIGNGGYAFFGKLSLAIGFPNGAIGTYDSLLVVKSSHQIFKSPYPIPSGNITVALTEYNTRVIYIGGGSSGYTVLGEIPDDLEYAPLCIEDNKYLLWGFAHPASLLTVTGQNLFLNAVYYLIKYSAPPGIPSFDFLFVALTILAVIWVFRKVDFLHTI
jgi:hypothetical protein